jgi:hypothetical protein
MDATHILATISSLETQLAELRKALKPEVSDAAPSKKPRPASKGVLEWNAEVNRVWAELKAATAEGDPLPKRSDAMREAKLRRGGSKSEAESEDAHSAAEEAEAKPKRGRPKGSKNKSSPAAAPSLSAPAAEEAEAKPKRGRPKGSKNKPKLSTLPPLPASEDDDAEEDDELQRMTINGEKVFVNMKTNAVYERDEDNSKGVKIGQYNTTTGKIVN